LPARKDVSGAPGLGDLVYLSGRRWVSDADMPGAMVADEMGVGKTTALVAAAIICKLLTENIVMGLPLSILWENSLAEWVNMVQNDFPGIIGDERERYPLRRYNSVPCHLIVTHQIPPQGHPVLTSALEPIQVVTMPGVAEKYKNVIDEMKFATDFKLNNLLHVDNVNLTHADLNTSLDEPENRWNIHLVLYDTLTSRAKPSSNGQLTLFMEFWDI
jgi:hypothetical protein